MGERTFLPCVAVAVVKEPAHGRAVLRVGRSVIPSRVGGSTQVSRFLYDGAAPLWDPLKAFWSKLAPIPMACCW
eukprot:4773589-Heterocapsa_arctica.AAC.1